MPEGAQAGIQCPPLHLRTTEVSQEYDTGSGVHSNLRAAQYVRMSTEHQNYSTENQSETIARYAAQRGVTIVRTYAGEGKSGLKLDGRKALQQMIEDVESGFADYTIILVYDISRWDRFQNPDESAYLEYICMRGGFGSLLCRAV